MRRRSPGNAERLVVARSYPNRVIKPRVGGSARYISRNSVLFPAPDAPVRKLNDPASRRNVTSRRISGPAPYRIPTFSKRSIASPRANIPPRLTGESETGDLSPCQSAIKDNRAFGGQRLSRDARFASCGEQAVASFSDKRRSHDHNLSAVRNALHRRCRELS